MSKDSKGSAEATRLGALDSFNILDSSEEREFNDVVELASYICQTPIALVSFVSSDRQWFKAKKGIDFGQTPRSEAFCAHAIHQDEVFVVTNATKDERFKNNRLVTEESGIRFYAGAPLVTQQGEKLGTICVIDTTERHLNKDQLKALQALARQTVKMLELRKANIALDEASKAKAEFFANMSHEIRTPMNGILGMTELALVDEKNEEQIDRLQIIHSSGQTLLALINDILDHSKIESGKMTIESHSFNLKTASRDVTKLLEYLAHKKKISLTLSIDPSTPSWVFGDSIRYKQVLSNIICNAVKFTHSGGVSVSVTAEKNKAGVYATKISVNDTGIGIAPASLKNLFRSFSQADSSTTRIYGGTGLGLSISKALCESMGGSINVESQQGIGSTFEFKLPFPEGSPVEVPVVSNEKNGEPPATRLRILVAEDNLVNQKVTLAYLKKLGHEATLVDDGVKAFASCLSENYDVILMDCHMPIMDGFEATLKIRDALPILSQPSIVALTASAMPEEQNRCYEVGMDRFLSKPLTLEALDGMLRACSVKQLQPNCNVGSGNLPKSQVR